MANYTTDLNLIKLESTDRFMISSINDNMDTLDTAHAALADAVASLTTRVAALEAQLAGLSLRAVTELPEDTDDETVYIIKTS